MPESQVHLNIPIDPITWSAPQLQGKRFFSPKAHKKSAVQLLIKAQYHKPPIEGYVGIEFCFYQPFPKRSSAKKKQLMLDGKILPTKGDCTNMQKFTEDCLNKIVILDDRYVVRISSEKRYAETGRIEICVYPIQKFFKEGEE